MSRVLTLPLPRPPPRLILVGASRTLPRIMRFFRRKADTSSLLLTSTWPFWICPFAAFRAVYSNIGIGALPNHGRANAPYMLPANTRGARLLLSPVGAAHLLVFQRRHPDHPQELLGVAGDALAFLLRYLTAGVELEQGIVHGLHAELLARLHGRVDLVNLVVADERADGGRCHHDFGGHAAAPAFGF